MRERLVSIENKMDALTSRLGPITRKLIKYDNRLVEGRISSAEDSLTTKGETLHKMDKVLHVIAAKNEDLEARSRRSNIRILYIPETANKGRMEEVAPSGLGHKCLLAAIGGGECPQISCSTASPWCKWPSHYSRFIKLPKTQTQH